MWRNIYKVGNNASKIGIFLWNKVIKSIWICNKLVEENKPYNEMAIFKTFVKNRLESEYLERREKFLSYWCYEGIVATCTDAFELNITF